MLWITNLKNYCLAGLALSLLMTLVLLNRALSEVAEKTAVIESMHNAAIQFKAQSESNAKEIGDAFKTVVEQNQKQETALKAARARFGSCNVARGIDGRLLHRDGVGEASLPESTGGVPQPELVVIDAATLNTCATDSAFVTAVHEWRVKNQLPISKE